jgi:hypothetical protein
MSDPEEPAKKVPLPKGAVIYNPDDRGYEMRALCVYLAELPEIDPLFQDNSSNSPKESE